MEVHPMTSRKWSLKLANFHYPTLRHCCSLAQQVHIYIHKQSLCLGPWKCVSPTKGSWKVPNLHPSTLQHNYSVAEQQYIYVYTYIYIYMCVCACVHGVMLHDLPLNSQWQAYYKSS